MVLWFVHFVLPGERLSCEIYFHCHCQKEDIEHSGNQKHIVCNVSNQLHIPQAINLHTIRWITRLPYDDCDEDLVYSLFYMRKIKMYLYTSILCNDFITWHDFICAFLVCSVMSFYQNLSVRSDEINNCNDIQGQINTTDCKIQWITCRSVDLCYFRHNKKSRKP